MERAKSKPVATNFATAGQSGRNGPIVRERVVAECAVGVEFARVELPDMTDVPDRNLTGRKMVKKTLMANIFRYVPW